MGGKKKTKWRKLPLEEFTKELPTKDETDPTEGACQSDFSREQNNYTPSYDETAENIQYYTEPYECIDGLYYPTSCVVYNPADVGMYSNYMMPVDNCYYYYTVPEMPQMPQMPEYVPMPYQDYVSALPKDTVYLLLPTQTLRPPQTVPNVVPEWQNRRRRRRYEGYAEYAVIPEKTNSTKVDEKEHGKRDGQQVKSRKNSSQSNSLKRMTSFSETSNIEQYNSVSERNQGYSKSNEIKKTNSEKSRSSETKEIISVPSDNNQKRKRSLEACGIHTKNIAEKKELQSTDKRICSTSVFESGAETLLHKANTEDILDKNEVDLSQPPLSTNPCHNPQDTYLNLEKKNNDKNKSKEQTDKTGNTALSIKNELREYSTRDLNPELTTKSQTDVIPNEEVPQHFSMGTVATSEIKIVRDLTGTESQSSLPDILSTLGKPLASGRVKDIDEFSRSPLRDGVDFDKGDILKSKSFLSQTSYLPNLLSSEALHNEMEIELTHLKNLQSLRANESIYKLAYDENVTDQSEADSRSPSPMDPESQVPSSLTNAEILIHEADSGSEAGSEDVELLPHRYESETFLNENKHVYVNKLSLAVELLRTHENLPYDEEFKRVVGENNLSNNIVPVHTRGKVNLGFCDDSCSPNTVNLTNNFENKCATASTSSNELAMQCQLKHSANSSSDSAIFSDIDFGTLDDEELCETAKEVVAQGNENQENTEGIRAGYRRFGVQARHYFSPRGALSFNPCFCCIIM